MSKKTAKKKKIFKSLDKEEKREMLNSLAENNREMQIWENVEGAIREYFEVREFKIDENLKKKLGGN